MHGLGDWTDFSGWLQNDLWGQALFKLGTGAAQTALGAVIQGELGPSPGQHGQQQQFIYSPYNAPLGTLPAQLGVHGATVATPTGTGTLGQTAPETDYTPYIVAGAGALLLAAVLS